MQIANTRTQANNSFVAVSKKPKCCRATARKVTICAQGAATERKVGSFGAISVQGTARKQNEDRYSLDVVSGASSPGDILAYAAVFDGHGGNACAEWLSTNFQKYLNKAWTAAGNNNNAPQAAITKAFIAADKRILEPKSGFLGLVGERGIGGSKCGATAAVAVLFKSQEEGAISILTANAGDARVLLIRGSKALQLTEDHVPDDEGERIRIESKNPNPNMPLVRYIGGTWRVGGLLALSRAFGDAYLKGTGQFEGVPAGSDGYSSGFGVVAEPYTELNTLTDEDAYVLVSSDGIFANEERGGGGGLPNEEVAVMVSKMSKAGKSCEEMARAIVSAAVDAGTTDDVTVALLKLQ